ncbi:hypothetical protein [Streptomyces scabiei]|uniref:hypothetical protein n=1 Tax=Streptomyces scabiei TaxID=1930 RepID=UPI0029B476CC|nr:hypothetical protein [Streptomyces scabiei]MDX3520764.1 hypothetical protein [Streptomyces scabiei]
MTRHFTVALFFGAVAAAVAYSDGASPAVTFTVGGLVAAATWALAYAVDHKRH